MVRITACLCSILCALSVQAQLGGTTVFNALNIYGSARVAAMGGSYIAIKDGDVNVIATNPSLLDSTVSNKLAFSYVDYYARTNMGYAAYAHSIGSKRWTLGGTMQYLNHGKMDETDGLGNVIGQFSASEYALTTGISCQFDSLWSIGGNLKILYANFAQYYSLASAVDIAATYYKPRRNFTAAFVLRNVGYQFVTFSEDNREKLPVELQIGISKKLRHAPFRFSLVAENLQQWNLAFENPNRTVITDPVTGEAIQEKKWEFGDNLMRHLVLGSEVFIGQNFIIRVGYNYRRRQELKLPEKSGAIGFTYGLGVRVSRFHISYGRAIYHAAGPSNHFTVSTDMSKW